ncbi:MAG: hypothetical protein ISS31_01025 [Kiritimatiellae bacterium]|nr:hypothetical protein [Kiritimatiellia bacterium]
MRHPKALKWERKLKEVFRRIDQRLEDEYGDRYPLHPARPKEGATANPAYDGLFNIGASFSGGFGSEHGAGYVVNVQMATLERVDDDVREEIEQRVAQALEAELPKTFPHRHLRVSRDGHTFKIHGDLSLGMA